MESFFSTLKMERVQRARSTERETKPSADVFDYIELFYNASRRHSRLQYLSPVEFERQAGSA